MTSFMGPMAPPPPAQPQPQAMDFQTDPNNRQRFRQFLNNRMQPPMMQQPAMMQAPAHMPPILPEVNIFEPQGYADGGIVGFSNGGSTQPIEQRVMKNGQIGLFRGQTFLGFKQEPEKKPVDIGFGGDRKILERIRNFIGLEDGGAVPPRRTDIGGQDHMLSYITPDEADILKALGGSGEPGPMGIPAYDDIDESYGIDSFDDFGSGMNEGQDSVTADTYSGGGSSDDGSSDADEVGDATQVAAMFDSYDDSGSDADEVGDYEVEQAVINEILGGGGGGGTLGDTDVYSSVLNSPMRQDERTMNPADFESKYGFPPSGSSGTTKSNVVDTQGTGISSVNTGSRGSTDVEGYYNDLLGLDDLLSNPNAPTGPTDGSLPGDDKGQDRSTGTYTDPTKAAEIEALQQLNRDLYDLSRRERNAVAKGAYNPIGLLEAKNVRNLASAAVGSPPGLLEGINIFSGNQVGPGLDPSELAALQSRGIRGSTGVDPFGRPTDGIIGFRDESGNVAFGRDPDQQLGGGGDDRPAKSPMDPCPPGFSLVNGTCTPVSNSGGGSLDTGEIGTGQPPPPPAPVIVPSSRQSMPFVGTMPSGYGTPMTGGVNPQVMSEMQKYAQLLSRPQPQYPVGLANGGSVSSNLDMAADNFLKALMPAA